ncbi:uncharacterized protein LOC118123687 isoform X1 [Hippoglossus stenolepis]|uniref:uncharacterized protein LOC118123687 isoform X1 n=1 Tax=Hippoglossus stenolepis TaxID=195615 RepID=UPI00159CB504|nr:uncharacterized protein LOC118123687 isoform X1 [Hippoglossus stenolepis]
MSKKYCSVEGCKQKNVTLHVLPNNVTIRDQWLLFVFSEGPERSRKNVFVCSAHFTTDCFLNFQQYNAGFSKRLLLTDGAIPTLQDSQPGTSQHVLATYKHVGTQTDPPATRPVATQLSKGTLREHVRSKGTQATVTCRNIGVGSGTFGESAKSSTPVRGNVSFVQGKRPAKRPRVVKLEDEDASFDIPEPHDSTYNPQDSVTAVTETSQMSSTQSPSYGEKKYIVYGSCLLKLFETCPVCQRLCEITPRSRGTFVAIDQLCRDCSFFRQWKSQPVCGSTPAGNIHLSAAIYFSGASFFQLEKIFKAMHISVFQYDTFRRHASMYLEPSILHKWKIGQEVLLQQLSQKDSIIIGGDMRTDSPGHSAKYGSYSVMHLERNTIIDIQLVQSNEVGGSYHMELEGLKRSLEHLAENGITLDYIVTDRHPQVQKYLKDNDIKQFYDIWHLEKGLSKKLDKIAKDKDCQILKKWQRSIKNHVYWTATSSSSGPEKVARWMSLVNHLQDVHTHEDPIFPRFEHPVTPTTARSKWFEPGSKSLYKVEKALLNKRALKDVEKLSLQNQTSSLEAFHSVILSFAPKNVVFPFIGMLCRLYLSAMHFNENADRTQETTSSGKPIYKIKFPKANRGQCTAKPVKTGTDKTGPTYGYIQELMDVLFHQVFHNPEPYVEEVQRINVPEPLSSQYMQQPKEEVNPGDVSCFSQGAV